MFSIVNLPVKILAYASQLHSSPHSSSKSLSEIPLRNSKLANDFDRLNRDSQND